MSSFPVGSIPFSSYLDNDLPDFSKTDTNVSAISTPSMELPNIGGSMPRKKRRGGAAAGGKHTPVGTPPERIRTLSGLASPEKKVTEEAKE